MDNEIEFKNGDEKNNMERVKKFFELSHCSDKETRCEYFGKALGCLWAIYENRSWWNRWGLFKSGKTGLKPVAEKIKNFVKSGEGYYGKTFLELLKVLSRSVLRGEKNGVWTTSSRNGVLGKKDVLDAIKEIKNTIETPCKPTDKGNAAPIPSADLPTQEKIYGYQKKKTVWGFLKTELQTPTGQEFADNLMTQASQMLLAQVKKGIISEYTSLLEDKSKVNRWFKSGELEELDQLNKNLKTKDKEKKEQEGISSSVYSKTISELKTEANELLIYQDYLIKYNKRCDDEDKYYINYDFDIDWVKKKIEDIEEDIEEYEFLDAMSDARRFRGRLLGSIEGLIFVVQSWQNNPIIENYEECVMAIKNMVLSEEFSNIFGRLRDLDKKKKKIALKRGLHSKNIYKWLPNLIRLIKTL